MPSSAHENASRCGDEVKEQDAFAEKDENVLIPICPKKPLAIPPSSLLLHLDHLQGCPCKPLARNWGRCHGAQGGRDGAARWRNAMATCLGPIQGWEPRTPSEDSRRARSTSLRRPST